MARALTMGLPLPINTALPVAYNPGIGKLNGDYQWAFAFRRVQTGARSNLSAATRVHRATPALTLVNAAALMTLPVTPLNHLPTCPPRM
jgi:hypothetical protein